MVDDIPDMQARTGPVTLLRIQKVAPCQLWIPRVIWALEAGAPAHDPLLLQHLVLSPSLLLRSLSLWSIEDANENLYKIHPQVTSSRCTRTLEHRTWGLKKESRPTLDSGRLDHGLPLLDFFSELPMFVRVFRDLPFQICVSADSYPSACQPVSKLVVHTYIYLTLSPFLSHHGSMIVHATNSFTLGPHLL